MGPGDRCATSDTAASLTGADRLALPLPQCHLTRRIHRACDRRFYKLLPLLLALLGIPAPARNYLTGQGYSGRTRLLKKSCGSKLFWFDRDLPNMRRIMCKFSVSRDYYLRASPLKYLKVKSRQDWIQYFSIRNEQSAGRALSISSFFS